MMYAIPVLLSLLLLVQFGCQSELPTQSADIAEAEVETQQDASLGTSQKTAEYRKLSAEEAKEIMDGSDKFILLDVRTEEEFAERRIKGAILIPDYEISERAEAELPDKDALILVYCRSGRRSALAANELVKLGYTNVYDFGGIEGWRYDTVSGGANPAQH